MNLNAIIALGAAATIGNNIVPIKNGFQLNLKRVHYNHVNERNKAIIFSLQ